MIISFNSIIKPSINIYAKYVIVIPVLFKVVVESFSARYYKPYSNRIAAL